MTYDDMRKQYEQMRDAEHARIIDEWKMRVGYDDLLKAYSDVVSERNSLKDQLAELARMVEMRFAAESAKANGASLGSADQTVWAMTLVVQWSKAPPGEHHKYYFERTLGNGLGMWTRDMDRAQPFEIHTVENLCRAQRRDNKLRAELEAHGYELVSVVPNRIVIPPADVMALPHTETQ